jgi:hypothetical protein
MVGLGFVTPITWQSLNVVGSKPIQGRKGLNPDSSLLMHSCQQQLLHKLPCVVCWRHAATSTHSLLRMVWNASSRSW